MLSFSLFEIVCFLIIYLCLNQHLSKLLRMVLFNNFYVIKYVAVLNQKTSSLVYLTLRQYSFSTSLDRYLKHMKWKKSHDKRLTNQGEPGDDDVTASEDEEFDSDVDYTQPGITVYC